MVTTLKRLAIAGMFLLPLATLPARAQTVSPTPEGTVITNTATASYTDANGNTYSNATASVSVTVGFLAAPNPTSVASVSPASPSTGVQLDFLITNSGNGTDQYSVSFTAGTGLTITGYKFGGNSYATLAALNTALAAASVTAVSATLPAGSETVSVLYNVASGRGGQTSNISMTATSVRSNTINASSTTAVTPPAARAVAVTLDAATVTQLPQATNYTYSFTVANTGNASDTYALVASIGGTPASAVTITQVDGVNGTTGSATIASGSSATVVVSYTVSNAVAAGTTDKIVLTATSSDGVTSDTGDLTVTVAKASVTIAKSAWNDAQALQLTAGNTVKPGEYFQYKVTVTNGASASGAVSVQVSDPLPAEVTYVSTSADAAGWTISETAGTVTANLAGTLAAGASRYFWIRVRVK